MFRVKNSWYNSPRIHLKVLEEDPNFGREAAKAGCVQYLEGVNRHRGPNPPRIKNLIRVSDLITGPSVQKLISINLWEHLSNAYLFPNDNSKN